ncbi:MAG: hypothetical protein AAF514_08750 [Verrucomicrobiota bacterium]
MANDVYEKERELNAGMLIRRALFFLLLIGLTFYHLFLDFRGLSHARGMDQAQIGREIAAGNAFATKFIRPLVLSDLNDHLKGLPNPEEAQMVAFNDISNAPLNPLLNSIFLRMFKGEGGEGWAFNLEDNRRIYHLDRLIAAVAAFMLLASIGVTYLLVSRIFDTKIGGVTALLVLLCSPMWDFAQSGLPQMLMLFLFSFGIYFLYKAVESQEDEKPVFIWIVLTAGFFGLLALTHWLTIWIFIGLMVFSAFYFRPRGTMALLLLCIFALIVSTWAWRNYSVSGNPFGSGIHALKTGLAEGDASAIYRNFDPKGQPFNTQGIFTRTVINSLQQLNGLYMFLGSLIAAPIFFLSLLHPFKRPDIAKFRWCIFLMWIFAVIGMTIYGIPEGQKDPNQLHILFAPIMSAYGLAFLTVLWNRIGFETNSQLITQGHLILVIIISAIPLILPMGKTIKYGVAAGKRGMPQWPPYAPHLIAKFRSWTDPNHIIVSDMPWAVAWYADRTSVWLPRNYEQFDKIKTYADKQHSQIVGLFLTPVSMDQKMVSEISNGNYGPWKNWIMALEGEKMIDSPIGESIELVPQDFPFPDRIGMFGDQTIFFSDRPRWLDN